MEFLQFSLMDMTPYDRLTWFHLVGDYNQTVWPAYVVALVLALLLVRLVFRHAQGMRQPLSVRWALAFLGASWCWTGVVFQMDYLAQHNWAAAWFAWAFILQGGLLLLAATQLTSASWVGLTSVRGCFGLLLLFAGLVAYPLSGLLEGRSTGQLEWFPLLPAPVTLVSIALLSLLNTRWRHALVLIPALWSVCAAAFSVTLGLMEVYFLVAAGFVWLVGCFKAAT